MNTILPKGFVFDSSKVLTPDRISADEISMFIYQHAAIMLITGIVLVVVGVILAFLLSMASNMLSGLSETVVNIWSFISGMSLVLGIVAGVATIVTLISNPHKFNEDCEFRFRPNSNLIVKQDYTYLANRDNYPITGKERKAYPYKVYVRNNISNKLVYLGHAKHGKVFLNDETATGKLFVSYCNYINLHHLNDKFTKTLKFERDSHLLDADGVPQYVLKGDGITLKAKPLQSKKYQIYVDKD